MPSTRLPQDHARHEHAAEPSQRPAAKTPARETEPAVRKPREVGGPTGPEPTRYGDWERNGRCYDF